MSDSIDYKQAGPATVLVHAGRHRNKEHRFVNPPIVKGSTVLHESVKDMIEREEHRNQLIEDVPTYGIWGTETHKAFYDAMKTLEGAAGVWAFASGLASTTTPLLRLCIRAAMRFSWTPFTAPRVTLPKNSHEDGRGSGIFRPLYRCGH